MGKGGKGGLRSCLSPVYLLGGFSRKRRRMTIQINRPRGGGGAGRLVRRCYLDREAFGTSQWLP
jgi:hypothetical protein